MKTKLFNTNFKIKDTVGSTGINAFGENIRLNLLSNLVELGIKHETWFC